MCRPHGAGKGREATSCPPSTYGFPHGTAGHRPTFARHTPCHTRVWHAPCHTRGAAVRPLHGSVVIALHSTADSGRNGNLGVDAAAPVALPCGQQLGEQNYTELSDSSSAACVVPRLASREAPPARRHAHGGAPARQPTDGMLPGSGAAPPARDRHLAPARLHIMNGEELPSGSGPAILTRSGQDRSPTIAVLSQEGLLRTPTWPRRDQSAPKLSARMPNYDGPRSRVDYLRIQAR